MTTAELVKGPPMKTISVNLPEDAIIFVPDGEPRLGVAGEYFTYDGVQVMRLAANTVNRHNILRRFSPSEYAELSKPKLPAVGATYRLPWSGTIVLVTQDGGSSTTRILRHSTGAHETIDAEGFKVWFAENKIETVYDPSKEQAP